MITKFDPDFNVLLKAVTRSGIPERIPCYELFADAEVMTAITGKKMPPLTDLNFDVDNYLDCIIDYQIMMGYDYIPVVMLPPLPKSNYLFGDDTAELKKSQRLWVDEHTSTISSWEDFNKYPWPDVNKIDYSIISKAAKRLPKGMKLVFWTSGIFENVEWLMGYEPMVYASIDEPELIAALFEKIGVLVTSMYEHAAEFEDVGLVAMGDDLGFKGGTLFDPDFLRKYVFPWQKKCVDHAHARNIPFILHSCGNLESIMDDLIDYVGIDGKHSYEDNILSVTDAKKQYGDRISIIGGIDIDFLCRSTEAEVRKRVRATLEECSKGGGYVMGTGNSVANYIPTANFIAMMDETGIFNKGIK